MGSLKSKLRNDGSNYIEDSNNMTLEEYKKEVEKLLVKQVGENVAQKLMTAYENDFPQFLKWNWNAGTTATAILMGV